jgi:hypothetical protein
MITLRQDELLVWALGQAPEGLACEFGVGAGHSLGIIAAKRFCYGFDSFTGLPEDWRAGYPKGKFACDPPTIPNTELVVGLFADTLPKWLAAHPDPIAFVHVDCDLYSSTKTVLTHIGPRLRPGSIIVFDEYFNGDHAADWSDDERRALDEADFGWELIGGSSFESAAIKVA